MSVTGNVFYSTLANVLFYFCQKFFYAFNVFFISRETMKITVSTALLGVRWASNLLVTRSLRNDVNKDLGLKAKA